MSHFARSFNASPASRVLRGIIALFIGAFALASIDTPLIAVLSGVAALDDDDVAVGEAQTRPP